MRTWDFYLPEEEVKPDPTGWTPAQPEPELDTALLEGLLRSPNPAHDDLEVAVPLARLVHQEFEAYGTSGTSRTNDDSRLLVRALKAVLGRLGIDSFDPPFRDFDTFYKFWRTNGGYGGARRAAGQRRACERAAGGLSATSAARSDPRASRLGP